MERMDVGEATQVELACLVLVLWRQGKVTQDLGDNTRNSMGHRNGACEVAKDLLYCDALGERER